MAYLLANETLPGDKIKAVGFGSQRPVASEATAEGRALNRRIDLIITPELPGATPDPLPKLTDSSVPPAE
jgi:flagellar motor protein MotB